MSARVRRLARGWVAAVMTTGLAAGSHAVADGSWPPLILLVLSAALSAPLCMALAGRLLSRSSTAAAVLLSQGLFHGLFAGGVGAAVVDHTGHHGAGALHQGPQVVITAAEHEHGVGMLAAHAVAAVLTYVLLRRGEVAGVRLMDAVALRVLRGILIAPLPVLWPAKPRTAWTSPRSLADQLLLPTLNGHRGPPTAAARLAFA